MLRFYGGSPRQVIFDNLKAAVLNGSGRDACLHPEFLALCGHYYLEPIACQRRDPESKGIVEAGVRYVKHNALQGRAEQLTCWDDYQQLAVTWRDDVANITSILEVLNTLFAEEATARAERALQRRIRQARLPKCKTLKDYDFTYPKRILKTFSAPP